MGRNYLLGTGSNEVLIPFQLASCSVLLMQCQRMTDGRTTERPTDMKAYDCARNSPAKIMRSFLEIVRNCNF